MDTDMAREKKSGRCATRSLKVLLILSVSSLAAVSSSAQSRPVRKACLRVEGLQAGVDSGSSDTRKADRVLNETYQKILKKYSDQPIFVERLREAQRAWLKFRDAQLGMRFPVAAKQNPKDEYGSVYPDCYAEYKAELTQQRTKQLSLWLTGIEEGDVCSGSVKKPEELK